MAEDEMVIDVTEEPELDLEAPKEPVKEAAPEKPAPKEIEAPKVEGLEELRAQLDAARKAQDVERAARTAAEKQAATATERVSQAHTQVIDSHLSAIESSTHAENSKLQAAEAILSCCFRSRRLECGHGSRGQDRVLARCIAET